MKIKIIIILFMFVFTIFFVTAETKTKSIDVDYDLWYVNGICYMDLQVDSTDWSENWDSSTTANAMRKVRTDLDINFECPELGECPTCPEWPEHVICPEPPACNIDCPDAQCTCPEIDYSKFPSQTCPEINCPSCPTCPEYNFKEVLSETDKKFFEKYLIGMLLGGGIVAVLGYLLLNSQGIDLFNKGKKPPIHSSGISSLPRTR